jgi:membrane protease YdiL (CAAX protease family)
VRKHLWNFSTFKLSGLALAVPAAILEEVFFRQYVMDALAHETAIIQILASALTFGIAHAIWGIRGGWRAAAGAVGSTTLMGAALAVVYLASGRAVLPCVVSHFLITAILEPWLLYAYVERSRAAA